jgi:hypothetical protein
MQQTNYLVANAVEYIRQNGLGSRSVEQIFEAFSSHESLLRYRLIIERNVSDFSDLSTNINARRERCSEVAIERLQSAQLHHIRHIRAEAARR